ncbi:MAG: carboxypeptidase regulatory-like domain-containing protein, partial [Anaerolineae bacterium]|nr:carboxypeptidase regulatory-like domain-containing protein [Anaerolineae bacterium]
MISRQRLIFLIAIVLALAGAMGIYLLQAQSQAIIEGVVVMARDVPVGGAVVRVRGSDDYVLTDDNGAFRLPISEADYQTAVTAWSPGYYIGSTDVSSFLDASETRINLHPHPIEDNSEYEFISPVLDMENPSACSHCHLDHSGDDLGALPVDEWLLDAHSGAAVNP